MKIKLIVNTSSGEDLYVYPYSIKYGEKQKLHYYQSPGFEVNNTNDWFIRFHYNPSLANYMIITKALQAWYDDFIYQLKWFFGSNCFSNNFKYLTWRTQFSTFKVVKELSYVFPATNVFGKNITLSGQLQLETKHKYIEEYYLTPTTKYFNDRLENWINEDIVKQYSNYAYYTEEDKQEIIKYQQQLRLDYKNWRDTELANGNEIEYLYSLNT